MALEPPPPSEGDWTYDLTERFESVVDTVRRKTTVPVLVAARGIVFGIVAVIFFAGLVVLVVIVTVRVLDAYLPIQPSERRVWVVYAVTAAIFMVAGALLWRMGRPKSA
jgi:hypothetical protein